MLRITQEETLQPQTKPNLTQNYLEPKGKAANSKLSLDVQQLHSQGGLPLTPPRKHHNSCHVMPSEKA